MNVHIYHQILLKNFKHIQSYMIYIQCYLCFSVISILLSTSNMHHTVFTPKNDFNYATIQNISGNLDSCEYFFENIGICLPEELNEIMSDGCKEGRPFTLGGYGEFNLLCKDDVNDFTMSQLNRYSVVDLKNIAYYKMKERSISDKEYQDLTLKLALDPVARSQDIRRWYIESKGKAMPVHYPIAFAYNSVDGYTLYYFYDHSKYLLGVYIWRMSDHEIPIRIADDLSELWVLTNHPFNQDSLLEEFTLSYTKFKKNKRLTDFSQFELDKVTNDINTQLNYNYGVNLSLVKEENAVRVVINTKKYRSEFTVPDVHSFNKQWVLFLTHLNVELALDSYPRWSEVVYISKGGLAIVEAENIINLSRVGLISVFSTVPLIDIYSHRIHSINYNSDEWDNLSNREKDYLKSQVNKNIVLKKEDFPNKE